jgi:hypothetical protein
VIKNGKKCSILIHPPLSVLVNIPTINALSEVKRERKKNKSLKEELIKIKEGSQNLNS